MTAPRTLTEALRAFDHDQLTELLRLRPDLRYPLPRQITELVSQATTSTSIGRAVDGLNAWQAAVAEALAVAGDGAGVKDLTTLLAQPKTKIIPVVADLRRRALLWGDDHELHLVRAARDHYGSYPGGLAPASPHPLTEDQIRAGLQACGEAARPVLDRLLWGPPTGAVRNADRSISIADARTPVEKLLAHRLLRPLDRDTVILAREVALLLRAEESDWLLGGHPVSPEPPLLTGPVRPTKVITSAAAGAANELVHDAELIITELDVSPRRLLRDGGLSTRDVTALARSLDGRTDYTAFLIEATAAAGLIGTPDRISLLPTTEYDRWISQSGPDRWLRLAQAWLAAERYFSATAGGHPLNQDAAAPRAPEHRKMIMKIAAGVEIGTVLDPEQVAAAVGWYRPSAGRSGQQLATVIGWTWQEASWLGLTALGAVSPLLPVLADGTGVPDDLGRMFPEPLEQVIIQSDLTAVAQGPLEAAVAGNLRLLADQESRGGGAVFRFSQSSVRRAFDAGWAGSDISEWLERHSATGIPQPLRYLIDDVARQHGTIRVGSAASYLRIEDPAQQAAVLAHPDAGRLRLRSIAPGVLVSPADPDEVVTVLQDLGLKPAAEDEQGRLLTTRPRRRAPARNPAGSTRPAAPSAEEAAAAILAAEQRLPPVNDDLDLLVEAVRTKARVTIAYVGSDGTEAERELDPVRVGDGSVRGIDPRSAEMISVPIARISSVTASRR